MSQILAVIIGALICAGLAVLVAWLYKDKPMQLTPCSSCKADCQAKTMPKGEQKAYYEKELKSAASACFTDDAKKH